MIGLHQQADLVTRAAAQHEVLYVTLGCRRQGATTAMSWGIIRPTAQPYRVRVATEVAIGARGAILGAEASRKLPMGLHRVRMVAK